MVVFEGERTVVGSLHCWHCWAVHISGVFHQPQAASRMRIYSDTHTHTHQELSEIPADSRNDQSIFVVFPLYIATLKSFSDQDDRLRSLRILLSEISISTTCTRPSWASSRSATSKTLVLKRSASAGSKGHSTYSTANSAFSGSSLFGRSDVIYTQLITSIKIMK